MEPFGRFVPLHSPVWNHAVFHTLCLDEEGHYKPACLALRVIDTAGLFPVLRGCFDRFGGLEQYSYDPADLFRLVCDLSGIVYAFSGCGGAIRVAAK